MSKNRMEAFSDGVIAIIITVMVLELRTPHGTHLADLRPLIPVFLSYVLSFVFLGIARVMRITLFDLAHAHCIMGYGWSEGYQPTEGCDSEMYI